VLFCLEVHVCVCDCGVCDCGGVCVYSRRFTWFSVGFVFVCIVLVAACLCYYIFICYGLVRFITCWCLLVDSVHSCKCCIQTCWVVVVLWCMVFVLGLCSTFVFVIVVFVFLT